MPTTPRLRTLAAAAALALAAVAAERPAKAQNTYADVPFNQGSLFYRPSGARPPVTTTTTTTTTTTRANRRMFRRGQRVRYAVPARTAPLVAPATVPTTYYYAQPAR